MLYLHESPTPLLLPSMTVDILAPIRKKTLIRDDISDPEGRIYINTTNYVKNHSVTRILADTAPEHQKIRLAKWLERPGSYEDRNAAAARGTGAHNHMEYVLKTALRLARATAKKRGIWKEGEDKLYRCPPKITQWAIQRAAAGAPKVPWASSGFARGLRCWAYDNIAAIHAVEFMGDHPARFGGACDLLCDLHTEEGPKGPFILDWKTTGKSLYSEMTDQLVQYRCQTGAYSLILKHQTGVQPIGGAIVVARRSGEPVVTLLDKKELLQQEQQFLERVARHYASGAPMSSA